MKKTNILRMGQKKIGKLKKMFIFLYKEEAKRKSGKVKVWLSRKKDKKKEIEKLIKTGKGRENI